VCHKHSPAGPHGVNARPLRDLHDEPHVGVVVGVGAAGHLHKLVRQPDVLRVLRNRLRFGFRVKTFIFQRFIEEEG
jgi:hypothetical protein